MAHLCFRFSHLHMQNIGFLLKWLICAFVFHICKTKGYYSPFHSCLPFEHLCHSNLFTRVCRLFVNQVTFYSILELKQCPRCQVFLKSIQHLSIGNDVTSSDKNIVIAWLKHIFISKFFAQHIQCILRTHICNRIETKAEFNQLKQLPDRYLRGKNST